MTRVQQRPSLRQPPSFRCVLSGCGGAGNSGFTHRLLGQRFASTALCFTQLVWQPCFHSVPSSQSHCLPLRSQHFSGIIVPHDDSSTLLTGLGPLRQFPAGPQRPRCGTRQVQGGSRCGAYLPTALEQRWHGLLWKAGAGAEGVCAWAVAIAGGQQLPVEHSKHNHHTCAGIHRHPHPQPGLASLPLIPTPVPSLPGLFSAILQRSRASSGRSTLDP
jgi:hypothetical protein